MMNYITTRDQFIPVSFRCFGLLHCQPLHHQEHHRRRYRLGGWSPQCCSEITGGCGMYISSCALQVGAGVHYTSSDVEVDNIKQQPHLDKLPKTLKTNLKTDFWDAILTWINKVGKCTQSLASLDDVDWKLKGAQTCMLNCTCIDGLCIHICTIQFSFQMLFPFGSWSNALALKVFISF